MKLDGRVAAFPGCITGGGLVCCPAELIQIATFWPARASSSVADRRPAPYWPECIPSSRVKRPY
jgi:hypothetical protein